MHGPRLAPVSRGQAPLSGVSSRVQAVPLVSKAGDPRGQRDEQEATGARNRHQVPGSGFAPTRTGQTRRKAEFSPLPPPVSCRVSP